MSRSGWGSMGLMLATTLLLTGGDAGRAPAAAQADPVADFYRGRNVNLLIGVAVGGSYDREARLIARHLPNYLAGKPLVVPQNMIGAGGMLLATHLASAAAQDGSVLGMMPNTIVMNQAVGLDAARYDAARFQWLGSLMPPTTSAIVAWHASPMRTLEDARRQGGIAGTNPKGSLVYTMTSLVNELVGTKLKIVSGYQGIAAIYLAMERGEVEAVAVTWNEFRNERADMVGGGKIRVLLQASPKAADLPDVPVIDDVVTNAEDRAVANLLLSGNRLGRPLAAAPGTPPERVAALRAAFQAMVKDPAFLVDAKGARTDVEPIAGETLQAEVGRILASPKPVIERAKRILQ